MPDYIETLLIKYRTRGLLIDTNLLLLYVVGSYDPKWVPRFKRTANFTIEDLESLIAIVQFFEIVVTTPNILTEVSNLSHQLPQAVRRLYSERFSRAIQGLQESYLPSRDICNVPHFASFGLTDSSIIELAAEEYLVLTDDLPLYHYLAGNDVDAVNFNQIRPLNW